MSWRSGGYAALQKHFEIIEQLALDHDVSDGPTQDDTMPDLEGMQPAQGIIQVRGHSRFMLEDWNPHILVAPTHVGDTSIEVEFNISMVLYCPPTYGCGSYAASHGIFARVSGERNSPHFG